MPSNIPYYKLLIVALFVLSTAYIHWRGRVRLSLGRQLTDHSTFMAPINCFMYLFSRVPASPYLPLSAFPEMKLLQDNWRTIREEALKLSAQGAIRKSDKFDDVGFNSFFKTGWTRFYLKWYGQPIPSAETLCPQTTALLRRIPNIKAAMFTALPPGGRLVRHRDPYAGSLRYHLGLVTPNNDACFIDVDGTPYSWRDGEAVIFDETYLHYAENRSDGNRIILFCDIERPLYGRIARAVNRFVSRCLLGAATSPNQVGDPTGGLNKAFGQVQKVRLIIKRFRTRNKKLYYLLKWLLLGGLFAWWLLA